MGRGERTSGEGRKVLDGSVLASSPRALFRNGRVNGYQYTGNGRCGKRRLNGRLLTYCSG